MEVGDLEKRPKEPPPPKIDAFVVKHEIKLSDTVSKPKCSQKWCKTVWFFSIFSDINLSGGGATLVQKGGWVSYGGGGMVDFLLDGGPPALKGKKPEMSNYACQKYQLQQ